MTKRRQYCHYCGEELGVYDSYPGDIESCGALECERSVRELEAMEREEAHRRLDEDMGYRL